MAASGLADWLKQAQANIDQVAEAELRLAASGQVSLATWEKQAAAVDYLSGRMQREQQTERGVGDTTKKLNDAFGGIQKSLLITSASLTGAYVELRHFASAANPGIFQSMDGAVQILTARIGGALLPVMTEAINVVLDVADWFESLSDGTKILIAGAVIAVPAVIALGHAGAALAPVLVLASAAMKKMTAAAKESAGAGAAMQAASVAAPALAAAGAIALLHGVRGPEGRPLFGEPEPGQTRAGRPDFDEMKYAWNALLSTHGKNAAEWNRMTATEKRTYAAHEATRLREIEARGERNFFATNGMAYAHLGEGEAAKAADILERFSKTGKEGFEGKEEKGWRKRLARQNMLATMAGREQQPRYSPLVEARKQFQLAALGKNPFEQALLKEQRETRKKVIEELQRLVRQGQEKGYRFMEQ